MCCKARAGKRAAEIPIALGRQRFGIEGERAMSFLERKQFAGMPDDVRIGDAVIHALNRRVGGRRIAPGAEQRPMRRVFKLPFGCAHPAIPVGHMAVLDVKGVDHAVADEPMMIGVARRELGIGTVAIERSGQVLRQFAAHNQIRRVGLERYRCKVS